jgi:hypothetical protein
VGLLQTSQYSSMGICCDLAGVIVGHLGDRFGRKAIQNDCDCGALADFD